MHLMETGPGESGPVRGRELVEHAEHLARLALRHYGFSSRTTIEVINLAENITLRLDDPVNDERAVMRLHRPGYHHISDIKSELQWLDALLASRTVEVPPPIDALNGDRVVTIEDDDGPRHVTVCGWLDGTAPDPAGDLVRQFGTLGAVTARLHDHVAQWQLPPGFCRRPWVRSRCSAPARRSARGARGSASTMRRAPSSRRRRPRWPGGSRASRWLPGRSASCTPICGWRTCSSTTARTVSRSCA